MSAHLRGRVTERQESLPHALTPPLPAGIQPFELRCFVLKHAAQCGLARRVGTLVRHSLQGFDRAPQFGLAEP